MPWKEESHYQDGVNNILLDKGRNNPKLRRLMIIHIIEVDYNLKTKILWTRRLVKKAEKRTLTGDPGREEDTATAKELHCDLAHISLRECITMENCAKS